MQKGWHVLLSAAREAAQRFDVALRRPRAAQLALLKRIVTANRDCRFGSTHCFDKIDGYDAFQARVPIATYASFKRDIFEIANGTSSVLTTDPVIAFEETGGTSSGSKLVPYTAASLAAFGAAVLPWIADLSRRHPAVTCGPAYISISPVLRAPRATRSGLAIGQGSDAIYLGAELANSLISILAVSPTVASMPSLDTWRRATLTELIEAEDLAFVSVWSPTFLLELVEAIPSLATTIAPNLSRSARARLDAALRPAAVATEHLWPHLATISCWTDSSSAIYAGRLRTLFSYVPIEGKGLLATEAVMTIPWGGGEGSVPALLSTFLEFVDEDGALCLCDSVRPGKSYRIVVTTDGGLYRYDIGDRVECISTDRGVPRLRFVGRDGANSDLVGEKIDESFAASVINGLGVVATLVARKGSADRNVRPHYELWLNHEVTDEATLANAAERLLNTNPQYAYARKIGQLGELLVLMRTNHVEQRTHRLLLAGCRLGDIKPVSLVADAAEAANEQCALH